MRFRLAIHSPLLEFSRHSSHCSYSCARIKQSQFPILRLSLEFDNRSQIYCDTIQLFNATQMREGIKKIIIGENLQAKRHFQNQYENVNCNDIKFF